MINNLGLWQLQSEFHDDNFREELLHDRLEKLEPNYKPLIAAIRAYEAFARSLQDAFDILKAEAARLDTQGFAVSKIANDTDFEKSTNGLHDRFEAAHQAFAEVPTANLSLQNLFGERFKCFAEPMDSATCALALCNHHEAVQKSKSADGKRPWFDRIGNERIHIRHAYRESRRDIQPDRYLHDYRGWPIRRFVNDLQ